MNCTVLALVVVVVVEEVVFLFSEVINPVFCTITNYTKATVYNKPTSYALFTSYTFVHCEENSCFNA
jgi:hypothetical protein